MIPGRTQEDALLNQSRIQYSSGGNEFVTYSNTVSTPVVGPVITLVKSSENSQAFPGVPVIFTVTVTNTGNRAAQTTIYDTLQAGTEFVPNSVHRDGVPIPGANPVTGLPLGIIGINETIRITFQLVAGTQPASGQLSNRVRGDYSFQAANGRIVTDSVLSNVLTLPVVVIGKPDILVTLSVNKTQASPGELIRYTAVVTNIGDVAADVVLLASIPNGTFFVRNSITVNGVMQSGDFLPSGIPLGPVLPRSKTVVTFDVTVAGNSVVAPGQLLVNQATALASYRDSSGNIVEVEQVASNSVDTKVLYPIFQLEVRTNPGIIEPEGVVDYTLVLTNTGNLAADVNLSRLIIGQTALVPGSIRINGVPVAYPGPNGLLYLGTVQPGGSVVITYKVFVSPLVISPVLRGIVTALFNYELNGILYNGEVISNSYIIIVETPDE
jgi:large repetitive protein